MVGTWKSLHVTLKICVPKNYVKNCDWFLGRLREIGLFENVALDSLRTIKLQICPYRRGLYALSYSVMCITMRNTNVKVYCFLIRVYNKRCHIFSSHDCTFLKTSKKVVDMPLLCTLKLSGRFNDAQRSVFSTPLNV